MIYVYGFVVGAKLFAWKAHRKQKSHESPPLSSGYSIVVILGTEAWQSRGQGCKFKI
jgi:hypothetical protein